MILIKKDLIQNDFYVSKDNSEFDDNLFDDDPFCNDDEDQLKMFDDEICKSTKLDDNHYDHSRSMSDSENLF